MKTLEQSSDGRALVKDSDSGSTWACAPEQAEKHLPQWRDGRAGQLSAGDASAIRDAAEAARKQRGS